MDPRLLFPNLPAELRNIIYSNTINPVEPATQAGLPLMSKTYTFSHTKVTLMPVHHGNPNLLALRRYRFQEANEYHDHILTNAMQLRINVLFNGHINTFVQEHWDKKIAAHLKNLVKKYAWLAKVMDYDIRFSWEPNLNDVGKRRRNAGVIVDRMVEVLTGMMDETLTKKRGLVKAELQVGLGVVFDMIKNQKNPLGLADFLSFEKYAGRRHVREVRIAHKDFRASKSQANPLPQVKGASTETNDWDAHPNGLLIFKKALERKIDGTVAEFETITEPDGGIAAAIFPALIGECTRIADD